MMRRARGASRAERHAARRAFIFASFFAAATAGAQLPDAAAEQGVSAAAAEGASAAASPSVSPPIVAWSVPAECPDARRVEERARSLAAVDEANWASAGRVRGRIVSEAGDWVLWLEIERAPGRTTLPSSRGEGSAASSPARMFHASDCGALGEAAAVAIALALGGGDALPAAAEAAPAERAPTPETDAAADASNEPLVAPFRSLGAVARAEAVLDTGSLGGLALGAGAELGMRWRALGVRAYGLALPSREVRLAPAQYVELSLWAAGLRGCYRAADGLPLVDVCGGAELGAFGAAGRGLIDATVRRDPWAATTWGTWFGVDLAEHLQAGARLEAVLPLSRERYLVNQNQLVHEMSGASLRLALWLGGML